MNQGKFRREELRKKLLNDFEKFMMEPTEDEALLANEISSLPVKRIIRESPERLKWGGMQPQECHQNCRAYADLDPTKISRQISGWWVRDEVFVLHSVIETRGGLICITPYMMDESELDFIPDQKIVWDKDAEGKFSASRAGKPTIAVVRRNPQKTIKQCIYMKNRLRSGLNPYDAIDLGDFRE